MSTLYQRKKSSEFRAIAFAQPQWPGFGPDSNAGDTARTSFECDGPAGLHLQVGAAYIVPTNPPAHRLCGGFDWLRPAPLTGANRRRSDDPGKNAACDAPRRQSPAHLF